MFVYTKEVINHRVTTCLAWGFPNNKILELFLMMKMHNA